MNNSYGWLAKVNYDNAVLDGPIPTPKEGKARTAPTIYASSNVAVPEQQSHLRSSSANLNAAASRPPKELREVLAYFSHRLSGANKKNLADWGQPGIPLDVSSRDGRRIVELESV